MQRLFAPAALIAERLRARGESLAVSESSAGGLISTALLSTAGASAFYLGGAVIYTKASREGLLGITERDMAGMRSATEAYASLAATRIRQINGAVWGLAETGATGPTGNRYGDAAGHACIAISGPVSQALTLETGIADRLENMLRFAEFALVEFGKTLS